MPGYPAFTPVLTSEPAIHRKIAWINFSICILSSILFLYFYVRSVSPAGQELVEGPAVYKKCYYLRLISGFFELVITINYVLFLFFPLPCMPVAERFP